MVSDWIRLCGGMLDIRVRGAELERFLNLCARKRIRLHRIERKDIDEMCASISVRDFYRLSRLRQRTRCRVHIIKRRGLPFLLKKLQRRYALWGGMLLMCFVCYELSTRIWVIQADFPQGVDGYAVLEELEQLDVGIGTKSADIDAHAVKVHMMTALNELKFFAVNVDGNMLSIETAAAEDPPENEKENGIHDVIALRDGVIQKQVVRRGTELHKVGDAVLQGDVLVDALVEPKEELYSVGGSRLVDASADIWAATRYAITRKMPLEADKKHKTGESKTRYAICFGKTRINLYFSSSLTQGNCDRIISTETIKLNDHLALPVSLYCETVEPYTSKRITHTAEELQAKLEYGVRRTVEQRLNEGNITSMQADAAEENGAAVLRAAVWCYEQIGESIEDGRTPDDLPQEQQTEDTEGS